MIGRHSYGNHAPPIPAPAGCGPGRWPCAGGGAGRRQAEGKPKGGNYWQKVSASNGTRYLCRSTTEGKIQKAAACTTAGAVKP
jgi:hypothetical protein